MLPEEEQKRAFNVFITYLENAMTAWNKNGERLSPASSNILIRSANLLIEIDEKFFDLKNQRLKIKELMAFIGRNAEKSLSIGISNKIMKLKKEIIEEQNNL